MWSGVVGFVSLFVALFWISCSVWTYANTQTQREVTKKFLRIVNVCKKIAKNDELIYSVRFFWRYWIFFGFILFYLCIYAWISGAWKKIELNLYVEKKKQFDKNSRKKDASKRKTNKKNCAYMSMNIEQYIKEIDSIFMR